MTLAIDITLFAFLLSVAFAVVRLRNLFAVVILMGVFSLITAAIFLTLDAPDVAFTEAAVGAGISTILFLSALILTSRHEGTPNEAAPNLKGVKKFDPLPLVVTLGCAFLLLYASPDMPDFGDESAPVQTHLAPHYIAEAQTDTGIANMVTAILASYRGFDTLGEVIVILIAGLGVMLLLAERIDEAAIPKDRHHHIVLRIIARLLIPAILLFALYVQFHGDLSAGGGFQAGVIFACAFILYALVFGLRAAQRVFPLMAARTLMALGVLLYAGTGSVSLIFNRAFLDYDVLGATPVQGQHLGVFLIEFGVGLCVASVMVVLFYTFASRSPKPSDEEW